MLDDEFELRSIAEIRAAREPASANQPCLALDVRKVPAALRHLVPLAERFGITDDLDRQALLERTETDVLASMKRSVLAHDDALDAWLAGPEAEGADFSAEYIAFTCLRMAADEV